MRDSQVFKILLVISSLPDDFLYIMYYTFFNLLNV
jgi:hypothetical protein